MSRRRRKRAKTGRGGNQKTPKKWAIWLLTAAVGVAVLLLIAAPWQAGTQPKTGSSTKVSAVDQKPGPPTDVIPAVAPIPRGQAVDDPAGDGWDTEVFSRSAQKQLKKLGQLIASGKRIDASSVAPIVTENVTGSLLVPKDRTTVLEDSVFRIQQGERDATSADSRAANVADRQLAKSYQGSEGLAVALVELSRPLRNATEIRFKFKIFHIESRPSLTTTRQLFAISGRTHNGIVEQNATWVIDWNPRTADGLPRISRIEMVHFEQVVTRHAGGPLFADCTGAVLKNNACYSEQLLRGYGHWMRRIQDTRYLIGVSTPGIAVGDVNGDGLEDLYLCQAKGLPNRLFLQNADGTATDAAATWQVDWLESSRSALLIDLDNDGDQDLAVAILGGIVLAENDQQRGFRLRDVLATGDDTMSLSAADYDADGWLDLYVSVHHPDQQLGRVSHSGPIPSASPRFVYHDANNAGGNHLFRSKMGDDGMWKFIDVTRLVGLDVNNRRWTFAAVWEDYDNDGDPDVYVANDFGRDNPYRCRPVS